MSELELNKDTILALSTLSSALAERVKAYFQDPQHRKEFEEWYKQTYGKDYEWKIST